MPGETTDVEAAAGDGQREGALHLLAGAHAARADDALRRVVGEIRVGLVLRTAIGCAWRRRSRSGRRAGRPRRPCPAARSRRWRRRSGNRADGRRCRAPSRPCAGASGARSGCARPCPAATGVVQEAGVPARPSISTRHSRHEPNASSMSVAQSLGICVPISIAARMIEVPSGTVTGAAVDGQRHRLRGLRAGRAVVDLVDERHVRVSFIPQLAGAASRRNPRGNG